MNWMVRQVTELEVNMNSVERVVEYEKHEEEAPSSEGGTLCSHFPPHTQTLLSPQLVPLSTHTHISTPSYLCLHFPYPYASPYPPAAIAGHQPPLSWPTEGAIVAEGLQVQYRHCTAWGKGGRGAPKRMKGDIGEGNGVLQVWYNYTHGT